jgi:hypothetical protein
VTIEIESVTRLGRDLRKAAEGLSEREVRYLVDAYYMLQENRIRADAQIRSLSDSDEPNSVLNWLGDQNAVLEEQVKAGLDRYSKAHPMGSWMRSVKGIGPVISAGMLAHIDITKAPTVGHIWRYAGLDPTVKWNKGEKRPWNARLKVLCWKAGESFVKVSGREDAFYGKVYRERKEYEHARNDRGENAERAAQILLEKKWSDGTEARKHLESGKLPPAQLHARSTRYAVKIFLSHLHQLWYEHHFKQPAPKPFAISHLNHAHFIAPPMNEAAE